MTQMDNTAEVMDMDDVDVMESTPVMDEGMIRAVEAMLFASPEPVTLSTLRDRLPDGADVGGILLELQGRYDGRGVTLVNIENTWAMRTAADLGDTLQLKREVRRPLSRAAMETMAIVAYHQPVTRAEIENIRGVVISGGTLDILMDLGWVKPGRRREAPGRPLTWVTTNEFLDHFGLQSLTDLPGLDELKASGLLDRRPSIEIATGDLFDEQEAEDMERAEDDLSGDDDEEVSMTEEELDEIKAGSDEDDDEDESYDTESDEDDSDDDSDDDDSDDEEDDE